MSSDTFCNVQNKISCCFETIVVEEPSSKRAHQSFRVVAGDTLRHDAVESGIESAHASEKIDGTCVYIAEFQGKPSLWARHDRKPNKPAERRFKRYQNTKRSKQKQASDEGPQEGYSEQELDQFQWDVEKDFKDIPPNWVPAGDVPTKNGVPQPDKGGHIPGWVPVDPTSRQHCWHLTAIDTQQQLGLFLAPRVSNDGSGDTSMIHLDITVQPLGDFVGCTLELIGTHINGNPYGIGTKQSPLHLLVRHGVLSFNNPPPVDYVKIKEWFKDDTEGQIEGIVWHCSDGHMYKLHRHHIDLKWPTANGRLQNLPVTINIKDDEMIRESTFHHLLKLNGKSYQNITMILC